MARRAERDRCAYNRFVDEDVALHFVDELGEQGSRVGLSGASVMCFSVIVSLCLRERGPVRVMLAGTSFTFLVLG